MYSLIRVCTSTGKTDSIVASPSFLFPIISEESATIPIISRHDIARNSRFFLFVIVNFRIQCQFEVCPMRNSGGSALLYTFLALTFSNMILFHHKDNRRQGGYINQALPIWMYRQNMALRLYMKQ